MSAHLLGDKPSLGVTGVSLLALMALSWTSLSSTPALAQVAPPESLIENAEPVGFRVGTVQFYPRVQLDGRYDSNIYNRQDLEIDDLVFVLRPSLVIDPNLSRHGLRLNIDSEIRRYADTIEENSEQIAGRLDGTLELRGDVDIRASLLAAERIERRGTFGDQFLTDKPVSYSEVEAGLGISRDRGRLSVGATGSFNKKWFDDNTLDGVPLDLDFRDLDTLRASLRASYEVSPSMSVFALTSANSLDYRFGENRNSSGYSVLAGIQFDLSDLAQAEFGIGYLAQNFENPAEPDFSGIDYYFSANWTPTQRIIVALAGGRSVERSPLLGISAVVISDVRLSGRYVFDEFTSLGLETGYANNNYQDSNREDDRIFVEASVRRQLRRDFAVLLGAGYADQSSRGAGARSYDAMTARVGLIWTP